MNDQHFELLSAKEMREKYGLVAENRTEIHLNPDRVPIKLRHLIPYAELWGVGDDLIREDIVQRAAPAAIEELREIIRIYDDLLDEWLAGPEVNNPNPSDEYLAFSNMRIAADCA